MSKHMAITVQKPEGLESLIDPQFPYAKAFLVVKCEDRQIVIQHGNNAVAEPVNTGAGIAAMVMGNEVSIVISGRYGPAAYDAFKASGVEMLVAPVGITAREALDRFFAGTLQRAPRGPGVKT